MQVAGNVGLVANELQPPGAGIASHRGSDMMGFTNRSTRRGVTARTPDGRLQIQILGPTSREAVLGMGSGPRILNQ